MTRHLVPVVLSGLSALAAGEAQPLLCDPIETVVAADAPVRIRLAAASAAEIAWTVADWSGAPGMSGHATAGGDGVAAVELRLPAGWHELIASGQRFGIIAADPAPGGRADPFFAVDAAMSWLVPDAQRRTALAGMAARLGLAMARERLSWNAVEPAAGRFDGVAHHRNDDMRATWGGAGMPLLEVFHEAPAWLGRSSGDYPADLAAAARSWSALGRRWAATTAAVEVWNEPELDGFSHGGAPEHLVALTRAAAWGLRGAAPQVLVGGGVVTTGASSGFRRRLWDAGLLATSDVLSFHDYTDPRQLEGRVLRLRRELAAVGEPAMPLWITESGRPWPRGPDRPERAADVVSAVAIAMRAVESRACGIARHFAFVLPFYPESVNNFGLTGRDGSPLRCLAAYSHLARRLAGLPYRGDLAVPGAVRARVFGDAARSVAVVWLGDPEAARSWTPGFAYAAAFGLDGRRLSAGADGALPAADGVVVLECAPGLALAPEGAAARLTRMAAAGRPRPRLSPVVITPRTVPGICATAPAGWKLTGGRIAATVWNLAAGERELLLALRAPAGAAVVDGAERPVHVPAGGSAEVEWRIAPAPGGGRWRIEAVGDADVAPAVVPEWREPDGDALLAAIPAVDRRAITVAERTAVDRNLAAGATLEATSDGEVSRLRLAFAAGDRWAYPRIRIPADVRLERYDAMVLRVRVQRPADVRIFAYEGGSGWYTADPLVPADGAWHWAVVRLGDFDYCEVTPADPDGAFDPGRTEALSIGCNSKEGDNMIEVSTWELVRLGGGRP